MSTKIPNEPDIINAINQGNKTAFKRLYQHFHPKVKRYIATKVSNSKDVEEITQDTFINFLDALPLFNHNSIAWTFIISIARHEIADYYRKYYAKKTIQSVPLINYLYDEQLKSSTQTKQHLVQMVEQVYQTLTPAYERILRLKYEDGLSVKQIATIIDLSVKATESKLYRARIAFQDQYTKLHGEPAFSVISDE